MTARADKRDMKCIGLMMALVVLVPENESQALAQDESTTPSAEGLLRDIAARGARLVLLELWENELRFDTVTNRIESGRAECLEVAQALKPASDAAASLSLNYSVARALPMAPSRVLRLVGRGFELANICTTPFIEPESGVAERYELQALKALSDLRGSSLASLARECADLVRLP